MHHGPAWSALLPALLLALPLAGCTGPAGADAFRIGMLLPLEGDLAEVGRLMRQAADLAAAQANAAGGVAGRPVELVYQHAGVAPAEGVAGAERLRERGVRAVVGAVASGVTKAALEVTVPARIPLVSPGSTAPELTNLSASRPPEDRWFFRTVASDALKGKVAAQYLVERNWSRVALLYDNNVYGNDLRFAFDQAFRGGGRATTATPFDAGKADYLGELQRALGACTTANATACPSGVFFVGYPREARAAVAGWWGRPEWRAIPWFFAELDQATFLDLRREGVEVGGFEGVQPVGAGAGFEAYRALAGGDPPAFSGNAYDAVMLVALAGAKAGGQGGAALRDALRAVAAPPGDAVGPAGFAQAAAALKEGKDVDYDGAAGDQDFDAHGDVTSAYEVFRVRPDGTLGRRCLVPAEHVVRTPVALPDECLA